MKERKKITLEKISALITNSHEDLARAVAAGFRGVDKRFDEMEKRFDGKLETVKEELQTVKEELQSDIATINRLPAHLEHRVDVLYDDMRLVKTKVGIR